MSKSKWVDVTIRKPEKRVDVLVKTLYNNDYILFLNEQGIWIEVYNNMAFVGEVTHWRKLPKFKEPEIPIEVDKKSVKIEIPDTNWVNKSNWISTLYPPKHYNLVLVINDCGTIGTASYQSNKWIYYGGITANHLTHWMELPENP